MPVHDVGAFRGRVFIAMAFVGDVELAAYNLGNLESKRGKHADAIASLHESLGILQRSAAPRIIY